ncbi:MAG: GntR family transcriptional regulator [Eubacterium sp.]|jgi:Transcriptional regulators|nr:GntR family transcriptional regulator [Eubacterium sp.]
MVRFKYSELSDWIREQIRAGAFKEGDRIPTEMDLSKQFQISRDTVRKGIAVLEKEKLLYRVKGSGTFVRDTSIGQAYTGKRSRSKAIGILMNDVDSYIFPDIVRGVNVVLNRYGYYAALHFTNHNTSQERNILLNMMAGDFAGYIIEPTKAALPQPNYDLYQEIACTTPTLLIHAKIPELGLPSLTTNDEEAGRKLTDYLLEQGHKKIAGIFKMDEQTGQKRYLGYLKAFQEKGIHVLDENIYMLFEPGFKEIFKEPLPDKLKEILKNCTAVICQDDRLAAYLKEYLGGQEEYSKNIVSCGFDDSDVAKEQGIISVSHPKEKFGEYAAMRLLDKIKNPALDISYDFNPKLVVR